LGADQIERAQRHFGEDEILGVARCDDHTDGVWEGDALVHTAPPEHVDVGAVLAILGHVVAPACILILSLHHTRASLHLEGALLE